jgi:hypothetical protein
LTFTSNRESSKEGRIVRGFLKLLVWLVGFIVGGAVVAHHPTHHPSPLLLLVFVGCWVVHALINLNALGLRSGSLFRGKQQHQPPPPTPHRKEPRPALSPTIRKAPTKDLLQKPKPAPDGALLGQAIETSAPLTLPAKTRERHLYLIGKSGTGKTTLIKNLIMQDMMRGAGVAFIDPHGDAATELLGNVPPHRVKDVIYFDPASAYAPAFNPFALPYEPTKLTEDIVSSMKMFFGESWGFHLEHLLRHGVLTLLTHGIPHTVKDLQSFFLKPDWKEQLVARHPKQSIRDFWQYDPNANEKGTVSPILNKLSQLLMPDSPMERIFSQRENDLDFSAILNNQKILIVNLAKGNLGDAPAFLLGGLIATGIQQAALARAALAERARKDFFLYVDEFHNYTLQSFNSVLAEARKYRLFLTLANQTLGQLPNDLERNIFGNVATLVSFGVSSDDARKLQHEMHRTRHFVREPKTGKETPAAKFMIYVREKLTQEYQGLDKALHSGWSYAFLNKPERDEVGELLRLLDDTTLTKDALLQRLLSLRLNKFWVDEEEGYNDDPWSAGRSYTERKIHYTDGTPLFPDYELKETTFPDVDDFINLPPHHAFARIERAENVHPFKTNPPPQPTTGTRGQILAAMRAQHEERAKKRADTRPARSLP